MVKVGLQLDWLGAMQGGGTAHFGACLAGAWKHDP